MINQSEVRCDGQKAAAYMYIVQEHRVRVASPIKNSAVSLRSGDYSVVDPFGGRF